MSVSLRISLNTKICVLKNQMLSEIKQKPNLCFKTKEAWRIISLNKYKILPYLEHQQNIGPAVQLCRFVLNLKWIEICTKFRFQFCSSPGRIVISLLCSVTSLTIVFFFFSSGEVSEDTWPSNSPWSYGRGFGFCGSPRLFCCGTLLVP